MKDRSLDKYRGKRDFTKTPEPFNDKKKKGKGSVFVIQKHQAMHLHYDFRLEMEGVLKSWAIPKGPSLSPKVKRLAILTDNHPLSYQDFEGTIPKGQYGAGVVIIWDRGYFKSLKEEKLSTSFKRGEIEIWMEGEKLKGGYILLRFRGKMWLLIKKRDKYASSKDPTIDLPRSIKSGKKIEDFCPERSEK